MLLKRSNIRYIMAAPALALFVGLGACSSDDNAGPDAGYKPIDGIALTIPVSSSRAGESADALMDRICIATYDQDGALIETIYQDKQFVKESGQSDFDKVYTLNGYGVVMSVVLPYETYGEFISKDGERHGIQFAAFYMPEDARFKSVQEGVEGFKAPADLAQLNKAIEDYYTLDITSEDGTVWQPKDDMHVPMAGILDITGAIKNYDPVLWNEKNPMFLNEDPLVLLRAMAKIEIINGGVNDGVNTGKFLTGAKFKTVGNGSLLAETGKIVKDGENTKVNAVSLPASFTEPWLEVASEQPVYTFYTFERDLSGINPKDVISVSWRGHDEKKVEFKPSNEADLMKPEWQGILRNHHYQFTLIKPQDETVVIKVKVDKWEAFDFEEKI